MLKPLFKWTGSKSRMKESYNSIFFPTKKFDTFIDCFYGAGSISHWIYDAYPNTKFVLNDNNTELVMLYRTLAEQPEKFIKRVVEIEEEYLSIPEFDGRWTFYNKFKLRHVHDYANYDNVELSAALLFMLKTNFNGWWKIYEYSNGRFASNPGTLNNKSKFIDVENLKLTADWLATRCTILNGDFEIVRPFVTDTSFVYFDPPYRDSFTKYTEDGFGEKDQIRLCNFFKECSDIGAAVSLSNKEIGDGFFEEHLGQFNLNKMSAKYTAGRGTSMNNVQEILVTNYEAEKTNSLEDFF